MNFRIEENAAIGVLRQWYVLRVTGENSLFSTENLQKVAEVITSDKITVVSGQYRNWVFNAPLITEGITPYNGKFIDKSRWTNKALESSHQQPQREDGTLDPDFVVVLEMLDSICFAYHIITVMNG